MRVLRIVMVLVGLTTAVVLPPWDAFLPWLAPLPDTVAEEVDAALDLDLDAIIVYVDRGGAEPAFFAAGWKNKETRVPADPHALFKIASIHKLYIATAVAKLDHAGVLSLDDALVDHLPDLAGRIEHADRITVRMLVQHRSGIPNYSDQPEFDWFGPSLGSDENLALVLDRPADFEPDARYRYSNTNYLLLGRVMDEALGYAHERYVHEEILAPLGLENTFFFLDDERFDDLASGYWYGYEDDLRRTGAVGPVGSMVATAQDVGTFVRALNDGSLLSDEEQATYASIYEYGHTGWVPGYYSIARYHPEIDTVVVQFVSTTGGTTWALSNLTGGIVGGKAVGLANAVYGRIVRILKRS